MRSSTMRRSRPRGRGDSRLSTIEARVEDWKAVFQVNFFAPLMLALGLMDELADVSSIAGSRVHPFAGSAYSTSKAALAALTREMAADFAPRGVRVNTISPGEIDTSVLSPGTEKLIADIPMRRLGLPEEVAKAIYFLCTEQSSYTNGAELHINGGQHV
jgi:NAD(P)-dependent dehydrogenase (short-subunit alcohol dehydrogenase family)